ncbi:hypothetical protein MVEG_12012 [Podila verticillata NRRL 6337]|uniref:Uncharacterized protein n=1 Tax=Podila verticillata NRRL 6337 TaxID=1069443 RepID=A0A086TKZ3_9FUNG|nr:hypothetical protein MVEG_12012 [Podila verticillata NRRL 6337]
MSTNVASTCNTYTTHKKCLRNHGTMEATKEKKNQRERERERSTIQARQTGTKKRTQNSQTLALLSSTQTSGTRSLPITSLSHLVHAPSIIIQPCLAFITSH